MAHTRTPTRCDQCGQVDDHPKVHLSDETKHHDCLSVRERELAIGSAQAKDSGPKLSAVIEAAEKGTHGDELLALIESGELPQAEGLHEAAAGKDN